MHQLKIDILLFVVPALVADGLFGCRCRRVSHPARCVPSICDQRQVLKCFFSTDLFPPDPQRLLVRQLPAASSGPQRQAAGANRVSPLQHNIQRRALAGAWPQGLLPGAAQCCAGGRLVDRHGQHAPPSPCRGRCADGWRGWLAGLSLAPAGGRSCVPPHSTDRPPLSRGRRAFAAPHTQAPGTQRACVARPLAARLRRW